MSEPAPEWDFEHQRAETAASVAELGREAGLKQGTPITLDLSFVPGPEAGDPDALVRALAAWGYLASVTEAGGVEASILDLPFGYEAIWEQEERASKIALARGFLPDGWGFWEP